MDLKYVIMAMDLFKYHYIFDHNLMTENDFFKAITALMKGEK